MKCTWTLLISGLIMFAGYLFARVKKYNTILWDDPKDDN